MRLNIKVYPKSKLNKIEKISETEYKVHLTSAPTDGKANKQLLTIMSKYFKIAKSKISIIKGETGREKILKIEP